jgi:hypothetical protein
MEKTIRVQAGLKRTASALEDDETILDGAIAVQPGRSPPQPHPFDPEIESSDSETGSDDSELGGIGLPGHLQEQTPIDDNAHWLNKTQKARGRSGHIVRNDFTIGGRTDIDLTSPFFHNVLDDNPKPSIPVAAANTKTKESSVGEAVKAIPNVSEWENW